jgi:hypothetical protein
VAGGTPSGTPSGRARAGTPGSGVLLLSAVARMVGLGKRRGTVGSASEAAVASPAAGSASGSSTESPASAAGSAASEARAASVPPTPAAPVGAAAYSYPVADPNPAPAAEAPEAAAVVSAAQGSTRNILRDLQEANGSEDPPASAATLQERELRRRDATRAHVELQTLKTQAEARERRIADLIALLTQARREADTARTALAADVLERVGSDPAVAAGTASSDPTVGAIGLDAFLVTIDRLVQEVQSQADDAELARRMLALREAEMLEKDRQMVTLHGLLAIQDAEQLAPPPQGVGAGAGGVAQVSADAYVGLRDLLADRSELAHALLQRAAELTEKLVATESRERVLQLEQQGMRGHIQALETKLAEKELALVERERTTTRAVADRDLALHTALTASAQEAVAQARLEGVELSIGAHLRGLSTLSQHLDAAVRVDFVQECLNGAILTLRDELAPRLPGVDWEAYVPSAASADWATLRSPRAAAASPTAANDQPGATRKRSLSRSLARSFRFLTGGSLGSCSSAGPSERNVTDPANGPASPAKGTETDAADAHFAAADAETANNRVRELQQLLISVRAESDKYKKEVQALRWAHLAAAPASQNTGLGAAALRIEPPSVGVAEASEGASPRGRSPTARPVLSSNYSMAASPAPNRSAVNSAADQQGSLLSPAPASVSSLSASALMSSAAMAALQAKVKNTTARRPPPSSGLSHPPTLAALAYIHGVDVVTAEATQPWIPAGAFNALRSSSAITPRAIIPGPGNAPGPVLVGRASSVTSHGGAMPVMSSQARIASTFGLAK